MIWEICEDGYECTRDPDLIKYLLEEILENGIWVQFIAPHFKSGPTVLVKIKENELFFDLPRPWDRFLEQARVVYRDKSGVFHFFQVQIIKTVLKERIVITSKPKKIYRLQRRRFYRISVPEPSIAKFKYKGKEITAKILNISGCGMAIIATEDENLSIGSTIEDVELALYLTTDKLFGVIKLPCGKIVREAPHNKDKKLYGIEFLIEKEKDRQFLINYVLKRELELRKVNR